MPLGIPQIQDKKGYPSLGKKYGQEQTLVTKMLKNVFLNACFKEKYFTSYASIG